VRRLALVVLALAVLWALPGMRGRVSAAALPALEKLGPAGDVVVQPVRRMVAKARATGILRVIAADYNQGRPVPGESDFSRWLQTRLPDETSLDPWGRPYWLQRTRGTITVGSSGPDGRKGTADDVKQTIPF
jgi:hypothetical protein